MEYRCVLIIIIRGRCVLDGNELGATYSLFVDNILFDGSGIQWKLGAFILFIVIGLAEVNFGQWFIVL